MPNEVEAKPIELLFDPEHVDQSLKTLLPIVRQFLDGVNLGDTLANRIGLGSDPDRLRPYAEGDNPRQIDWKATARHPEEELQVRTRVADINPSLWVVTDIARDRYDAGAGFRTKRQLGMTAMMSLLALADLQRVPTGIITANDNRIVSTRHPSNGRTHIRRIGHQLADLTRERASGDKESSLQTVLDKAAKYITQKSAIVVLSGFRDSLAPEEDPDSWRRSIRSLVRLGHDVSTVEIVEPFNFELPKTVATFRTGKRRTVQISPRQEEAIRQRYSELSASQDSQISSILNGRHLERRLPRIKLDTADPNWFLSFKTQLQKSSQQR